MDRELKIYTVILTSIIILAFGYKSHIAHSRAERLAVKKPQECIEFVVKCVEDCKHAGVDPTPLNATWCGPNG